MIALTITYDSVLQEITGLPDHPVVLDEGKTFADLMNGVRSTFPEIFEKYPPGVLGFTVNGVPPSDVDVFSSIDDGDVISFVVKL